MQNNAVLSNQVETDTTEYRNRTKLLYRARRWKIRALIRKASREKAGGRREPYTQENYVTAGAGMMATDGDGEAEQLRFSKTCANNSRKCSGGSKAPALANPRADPALPYRERADRAI